MWDPWAHPGRAFSRIPGVPSASGSAGPQKRLLPAPLRHLRRLGAGEGGARPGGERGREGGVHLALLLHSDAWLLGGCLGGFLGVIWGVWGDGGLGVEFLDWWEMPPDP